MRGYPEQGPHDLVETTDASGCAADDIDHFAPRTSAACPARP